MKNTFALVLAALLVAGTATTAFAAENAPVALEGEEEINLVDEASKLLIGPEALVTGTVEDIFDGDPTTVGDFGVDGGEDYWVGIKLDQPTILTKVEMHGPGYNDEGSVLRPHVLYGAIVEGSNDGENWNFILQLGDDYLEYEEYAWDMEDGLNDWFDEAAWDLDNNEYVDEDPTDPVAYTYYRVWNDTKGVAIYGDIQLYGYYVEAETEAPETEAPETAAPETAAPETAAPETAAPETAAPETAAPETAAPETAAPETEAPETEAPVTEAPETEAPETEAPETEAPETEAPETEAPETAAPETAAPETAAPETAAPETAAPETAAPETAAPETAAPETAAPETAIVNLLSKGEIITTSANDVSALFDGTLAGGNLGGAGNGTWVGIKLAEPTLLSHVTIAACDNNADGVADRVHTIFRTVIEGSNDGENWTFIMDFGDDYLEYEDYAAEIEEGNYYWTEYAFDADGNDYVDEDPTEPVAYQYYRAWNSDDNDAWGEIAFYGVASETEAPETAAPETAAPETAAPETAAPETAAPETAAPETAAPETAAPETAAPETAAPETAAPETAAPETEAPTTGTDTPVAPQTFDFGVIAAAVAVVSAAGYAIAKKRK